MVKTAVHMTPFEMAHLILSVKENYECIVAKHNVLGIHTKTTEMLRELLSSECINIDSKVYYTKNRVHKSGQIKVLLDYHCFF